MNSFKVTLFVLLFAVLGSCKKDEQATTPPAKQQLVSTTYSIENSWWHAFDNSEHTYFDSNGRYYYMKGAFNLNDTVIPDWQGHWNWLNGDTMFINYQGVHQGVCVIKTPHKDSLRIDINVKGTYPIKDYPWVR